jgi:small subunit ribosomal protein S6
MNENERTYEGMFLLDSGNPDFEAVSEPVRAVLGRSEAEVLSIKPWDDRKLAYEIKGRRRGLYVLTYFKADPGRITEIEHDCQLSEQVVRVLILQRKSLSEEQLQAETPALAAERKAAEHEVARKARQQRQAEEKAAEAAKTGEESAEAAKTSEQSAEAEKTDEQSAEAEPQEQQPEGKADEQTPPEPPAEEPPTT